MKPLFKAKTYFIGLAIAIPLIHSCAEELSQKPKQLFENRLNQISNQIKNPNSQNSSICDNFYQTGFDNINYVTKQNKNTTYILTDKNNFYWSEKPDFPSNYKINDLNEIPKQTKISLEKTLNSCLNNRKSIPTKTNEFFS